MAEKGKVTEMVLTVNLQSCKCYKKVKNLLGKFPGIQEKVYDKENNKVTIKVVCCCPEEVRDKLCCKGGGCIKSIEILKPPPPAPSEPPPAPSDPPQAPSDPPPAPPPRPCYPPTVFIAPVIYCCTNCCKEGCKGPCYNPCYCRGYSGRPVCDCWCRGGGYGGYYGCRCRESYCEVNSQYCKIM